MAKHGLSLDWEGGLLKQALTKHIHNFDAREGHRRVARAVERIKDEDWTEKQKNRPKGSPQGHFRRKARPISPRESADLDGGPQAEEPPHQEARPVPTGHSRARLLGTMDLKMPTFSAGNVRARISECIDADRVAALGGVEKMLSQTCLWQQSPTLSLGLAPRAASPKSPKRSGLGDNERPLGGLTEAQRQRSRSPESRRKTRKQRSRTTSPDNDDGPERFTGSDPEEHTFAAWPFMRHLPGGNALQAIMREQKLLARAVKTEEGQDNSVLYSDLAALLWARGPVGVLGESNPKQAPTVMSIVMGVPLATGNRWRRHLKIREAEEATEAAAQKLARRLIQVMAKQRAIFVFPTTTGTPEDELAQVQLSAKAAWEISRKQPQFGWLALLPVIGDMDLWVTALSHRWRCPIDKERLNRVAAAVERAESLRLCGGPAALEDKLQVNGLQVDYSAEALRHHGGPSEDSPKSRPSVVLPPIKKQTSVKSTDDNQGEKTDKNEKSPQSPAPPKSPQKKVRLAQRGLNGIETSWLLAALADTGQELSPALESGNVVRLLTLTATELGGMDELEGFEEDPPRVFSSDTWLRFCAMYGHPFMTRRTRGSSNASEQLVTKRRSSNASEMMVTKRRSSVSSSGEEHSAPGYFREAEGELRWILASVATSLQGPALALAVSVYAPLLVEATLQRVAVDVEASHDVEHFVGDMLWHTCGWNTPSGRRNLRRLCSTFDRYTKGSELSRPTLLKLAQEAGWINSRDQAARNSKLLDIYETAVRSRQATQADFVDFIYIVEVVVDEILRPKLAQEWGLKGLAPIVAATEIACTKLVSASVSLQKARQAKMSAMTVRQPNQFMNGSARSSRMPSLERSSSKMYDSEKPLTSKEQPPMRVARTLVDDGDSHTDGQEDDGEAVHAWGANPDGDNRPYPQIMVRVAPAPSPDPSSHPRQDPVSNSHASEADSEISYPSSY